MTIWKISHKHYWRICGDGKELARCDNEEDAKILLNAIEAVEILRKLERRE
jgi:hypothetical protein